MKGIKEIIKELEKKILELDIILEKDLIFEISDILAEIDEITIPHTLKKFFYQFKILIEEIKSNEIPLEKEVIYVLKLLLRKVQEGEKEAIKEEIFPLMIEFLKEGNEILQGLKEKEANIESLLHRFKGIMGIYMSICKDEERYLGEELLQRTKNLEEKAKKEKLSKEEIEGLESIFNEIRDKYEKI